MARMTILTAARPIQPSHSMKRKASSAINGEKSSTASGQQGSNDLLSRFSFEETRDSLKERRMVEVEVKQEESL